MEVVNWTTSPQDRGQQDEQGSFVPIACETRTMEDRRAVESHIKDKGITKHTKHTN